MEIMVFFSLLLLVCSVSTNQTKADKEINDQQISNQQYCAQDIHAVLREMTASLTEQKVEIRTLKQENQDHITKLKELESQKTEIDQLKQRSKEQEAKLESQKSEINQLKQELQVKQVAFSASLWDQGDGDTGPFNREINLIFKHVVTNIGKAYNSSTGIFTAPVRGVYHFDWTVFGQAKIQAGGVLFRNRKKIFLAYERQPAGWHSASNGASLLLEVGDQVSVRLLANSRIHDDQDHLNTFSGHLIFTM